MFVARKQLRLLLAPAVIIVLEQLLLHFNSFELEPLAGLQLVRYECVSR